MSNMSCLLPRTRRAVPGASCCLLQLTQEPWYRARCSVHFSGASGLHHKTPSFPLKSLALTFQGICMFVNRKKKNQKKLKHCNYFTEKSHRIQKKKQNFIDIRSHRNYNKKSAEFYQELLLVSFIRTCVPARVLQQA